MGGSATTVNGCSVSSGVPSELRNSRLAQHLALPPTSLRSLCQLFDLDGDGHLTQEEFRQAFDPILEEGGEAAQGEALFEALDTDHDGSIDVEELLAALAGGDEASPVLWEIRRLLTPRRIGRHALSHRARAAFRTSDADGDGVIDFPRFATVISLFGVIGGEADLRGLFDSVDADEDGQIEEPELLEAVSQARSQGTCRKSVEQDALFSNASVNISALRRRAYNHRWAVHAPDVIPLSAADSDFPVSTEIVSAVQQYLGSGYVPYGPAEGLLEFRRIAAETLRMRHGLDCDPDAVFPTDGAASALFLVARLAITSPGEEAIIPDPVDFLLYRSVRAAGGVVKRLPYRFGTFDPAELESLITPQTRLISLCNPHNPLGRVLRREELEALAAVAMRNNLWILSDEVWSDIVYPPNKHISIATLDRRVAERTFTVFGFSKSYGLAGMRLGLLVAPSSAQRDRILRLSHANDTAYGVSTVSQVAGAAAYERGGAWLERFVAHLRSQRDYAVDRLNLMPDVRCETPEGTYVVFPDVSRLGVDQDALADLLLKRHRVAVIPGSRTFFGPGAEGHVRLTLATSRAILAEGLDRLEQGIHSLRDATRVSGPEMRQHRGATQSAK